MTESFEYDVFLSHSSKDKPAVRELAERLKGDGLRVWLDEWVIQPGDSIPLAIEQGLERSRTLVLVMSEHAFASDWVTLERYTALFRDPTNHQRRFIPLRLDDAPIKDSLKQFAYVDWRGRKGREYARLLAACQPFIDDVTKYPELAVGQLRMLDVGRPAQAVALARNGELAVLRVGSSSSLEVWDVDSCARLGALEGHAGTVLDFAPAPNTALLVSGSVDGSVRVWDLETLECVGVLDGHRGPVVGVSATADGRGAISGSYDRTVRLWNLHTLKCEAVLRGHDRSVLGAALDPSKKRAVSYSRDGTVRVWDLPTRKCLASYTDVFDEYDNKNVITRIAITRDCRVAVSSWRDGTVRVWDLEAGICVSILEGHRDRVVTTVLTSDGTRAFSLSQDTTLRVWNLTTGYSLSMEIPGLAPTAVAISPNAQRILLAGDSRICVFEYALATDAVGEAEVGDATRYTNAKVLLVGDSGVGKSGLAIRLTQNGFEPTASTDAHWATQLKLLEDPSTDHIEREIWLWDFGGQADYRLIHQLFMDETALAVLVFNPQSENPFEGLGQWDRDLARAARRPFQKLLVAGRCDRGALMVSRRSVEQFAAERGFAEYLETSALTGQGCDALRDAIVAHIDWDSIPWTASPRIFKLLKDEIVTLRDEGVVLLRMGELKQQLEMRLGSLVEEERHTNGGGSRASTAPMTFRLDELRAVVGLLAGPGIVWQLEFGDFVLLQPERVNAYAAAVIRKVRQRTNEHGCIDEEDVLAGRLDYQDMKRLPADEETLVLRAMHQVFVERGLCLREHTDGGTQLVFPSFFRRELPQDPGHPPVLVSYRFSGPLNEIYATLVVRLYYTKAFENDQLWRYAADFRCQSGLRMGLKMTRRGEGAGEISVYFDPQIPEDAKVTFIKYVHEHLLEKAQDVSRRRHYVCPSCGVAVANERAIELRLEKGFRDMLCGVCEKRVQLFDLIEEKFASEEFQRRVRELEDWAKKAIDNESRELILVGHAYAIAGEAGQIYRQYTNSDHGIDGEIEFKDWDGNASGEKVYLQLKSGDSYLYKRKSDGAEVFQIRNQRWSSYWQKQAYPVMLVIRTSDERIRWMNVSDYLKQKSNGRKTPVTQIVFDGEPFTALNLQRMRDRLIPLPA